MKTGTAYTVYEVHQVKEMSDEEFSRAVEKTTQAFAGDPTFDFIFRSPQELSQLVDVNFRYYLKKGKVYGAFDENGVMQGVSLWSEPDAESISVKSVIESGLLANFCKLFFRIRLDSFYRMVKMSDCSQLHHLKSKHCYLYWITAFTPGAGSALLEDAAKRYGNYDFYLENSNHPKNYDFYRKFDFEPLPEIGWNGGILHPMLRKGCCD